MGLLWARPAQGCVQSGEVTPNQARPRAKHFSYVTSRSPRQASEEGRVYSYWVCSRSCSDLWDSHLRFSGLGLSASPATRQIIIIIIITCRCRGRASHSGPHAGLGSPPGAAVRVLSPPRCPRLAGTGRALGTCHLCLSRPRSFTGRPAPNLRGAGVHVPAEAHTPYV